MEALLLQLDTVTSREDEVFACYLDIATSSLNLHEDPRRSVLGEKREPALL
jgi:hypothetical protein